MIKSTNNIYSQSFRVSCFAWLLLVNISPHAQMLERSVLNSFGNAVTAGGLYLEHNGGEVLTQSFNAGGIWLLQGFLQPDKELTGLEGASAETPGCPVAFPVPFHTFIELKDAGFPLSQARLHDAGGRLVWQQSEPGKQLTRLPESLAEGVYVLTLYGEGRKPCTYKVLHLKY
jgi:hypothetical protein